MVFKKKKRTKWGTFYRSEYEFEAMRWCVNNNIKIGPLATTPGEGPTTFWIEIFVDNKKSRDPSKYDAEIVWQQIYKYYIYYYEKYRDRLS